MRLLFFFSSRRRHTRWPRDWSSDVCSSDLRRLLDGDRPVHLLDVRWALDGSKGRHDHLEGHLPGAVYIDLPTELAEIGRASCRERGSISVVGERVKKRRGWSRA